MSISPAGIGELAAVGWTENASLQSVLARDDHVFAGRQTLQDDRLPIALLTDRDIAHLDLVVAADDEGIEAIRSALDRVVGDDDDLLQRVDQQAGRDRQAGPQGVVRIRERRLHLDGAARLVDRVVDEREMALRQRLSTRPNSARLPVQRPRRAPC